MTLDLYDWTIQTPGRGRNGYIWGVARHVNGLRKRATWVRRMDALTAPTHRDALRVAALAGDDGVTAGSLSSELKATRAHMLNVLNELETQGFVKGTPAKGRRRPGVGTVYRIQLAKVYAALDELRAWLTGEGEPVSPARETRQTEKGDPS